MDVTRTAATTTFIHCHSLRPAELLRRLRDPSPPVAGLLIDLCGVLYDDSTWPRWLLKLVQRLGLHTSYTPFFRVWRREYLERVKRGELEYWQALRLFLRAAGLTHGQIDEVEAASHARRREYESGLRPMPGAANVLRRLNQLGIHLTLLSSACLDREGVCQRLDTLGLTSRFDQILAIPDLWREQPGRSVFQIAAERSDLALHRLGYVGRDATLLAEAGQHGIRRIAVNYDDDARADIFLSSIDRLLDAVVWDIRRVAKPTVAEPAKGSAK